MAGVGCSASKTSADIDQALTWLPANTETMLACRGPFEPTGRWETALQACQTVSTIGLPNDGEALGQIRANWIVQGTRNYRPATSLGLCRYDGCKIIGLRRGASADAAGWARKAAADSFTFANQKVYVFRERKETDQWSFYVTFVGDLMFCATDKTYLAQVLNRKNTQPADRALPSRLPQWKYIDRAAPFWAVRRFTPQANKARYGMNMDDEGLTGYAVSLDKRAERLTVISMSKSHDGHEKAKAFWNNMMTPRSTFPVIPRLDGYTKIVFGEKKEDWGTIGLFLVAALGHPVFI